MSNPYQEPYVTKREFNLALTTVWLFITIVVGAQERRGPGWSWALLVISSCLMCVTYAAASIRQRRKTAVGSGDWTADAKQQLAAGDKIGAITTVRNGTMMGLAEARDLVESWAAEPPGRSE